MAKSAAFSARGAGGWFAPALLLVAVVTAARIALLAFNRTDLYVDEAQYWLWGRDLALGYYSKPPLIAWVIGGVTRLAGSDAPFWVRLPAPVFHGVTALVLGAIAADLYGRRAAIWVAAGYLTLPMVAVGSLLISTDTIMFPFLALALRAWLRGCGAASVPGAVFCGAMLGLAAMAKYAALYYLLCAGLAALLIPQARPPVWFAALCLAALALVLAPNVLWNAMNGFSTLSHTLDNADWVRDPARRAGLHPVNLATFFGSQFAVFGPVAFGAWLMLCARAVRGGGAPALRVLVLFSVPIVLLVCGQALLSRAYANWAAAAYLAASVMVFAHLLGVSRGWRLANFAVNGALCVALPVSAVFADRLAVGGDLLLARFTGQAAMTRSIIEAARTAGVGTVVAEDRGLLADLFYTGRDAGIAFHAVPPTGRAAHHYALKYPFAGQGTDPVLFVGPQAAPPACLPPDIAPLRLTAAQGTWAGRPVMAYVVPATCWAAT